MTILSKLRSCHYWDAPQGEDLVGKIVAANTEILTWSPIAFMTVFVYTRRSTPRRVLFNCLKLATGAVVLTTVFTTSVYFFTRTFDASPSAYYPFAFGMLPVSYIIHRYWKISHHCVPLTVLLMTFGCTFKKHHMTTGGENLLRNPTNRFERTVDHNISHTDPRPKRELAIHWRVGNQ